MIAPSPLTTSFLGLCNTSTETCDQKKNSSICDFKTTLEGLDHQYLWWLEKAATSKTPDLEILQGITPVENVRVFGYKTLDTKRGTLFSLWKAF